eukprot:TRINITY_DN23792_c0_g1_i3.p1 TRINITY_DN23792_c0_g1~~TRINITY_DN23792_c0_g1_i3.p1  ORF type:complete len:218 (+),score=-24.99 TRINITY_DN23792_c0_g1_i3:401-1054(+)
MQQLQYYSIESKQQFNMSTLHITLAITRHKIIQQYIYNIVIVINIQLDIYLHKYNQTYLQKTLLTPTMYFMKGNDGNLQKGGQQIRCAKQLICNNGHNRNISPQSINTNEMWAQQCKFSYIVQNLSCLRCSNYNTPILRLDYNQNKIKYIYITLYQIQFDYICRFFSYKQMKSKSKQQVPYMFKKKDTCHVKSKLACYKHVVKSFKNKNIIPDKYIL